MEILTEKLNYVKNYKSELRNMEKKLACFESTSLVEDRLKSNSLQIDAKKTRKISPGKLLMHEFQNERIEAGDPSVDIRVSSVIYPFNNNFNTKYLNDTVKWQRMNDNSKKGTTRVKLAKRTNQIEDVKGYSENGLDIKNLVKRKSIKITNTQPSINTCSWKDSEYLVNEHFKKIKKDKKDPKISTEDLTANKMESTNEVIVIEDKNKKMNKPIINVDSEKRLKIEEKPINYDDYFERNSEKNSIFETTKSKKTYDLAEIRQFIEQQKSKRTQVRKINKEKYELENRKKAEKLQALVRKQRENTIKKQKNTSEPNIEELFIIDTESILDKNKEVEIRNLLENNYETMSKKLATSYENLKNNEFERKDIKEKSNFEEVINSDTKNCLNNDYFILKHERLKSICNLALDLQTKLHETSVNVLNYSMEPFEIKKIDEMPFGYYKTNMSNFQSKQPGNLDAKKLQNENKFVGLSPEYLILNSKKYDSEPKIIENSIEFSKSLSVKTNPFSSLKKLEEPNWTVEADSFSFLKVTREKLKKGKIKSDRHNSCVIKTNDVDKKNTYIPKIETLDSSKIIENKTVDCKENTEEKGAFKETEYFDDYSVSEVSNKSNDASDNNLRADLSVKFDSKLQPENEESFRKLRDETNLIKPNKIVNDQFDENVNKLNDLIQNFKNFDYADSKREFSKINATKTVYSPSTLEKMMTAGLNYLETINFSTIQLEELDKVRCVGLAQNENVILAHVLRNHQLEKDIKNLKQKSNEEVLITLKDNKNLLSKIQNKINLIQNNNANNLKHQLSDEKESEIQKSEQYWLKEAFEENSLDSNEPKSSQAVKIRTQTQKNSYISSDTDDGTISTETLANEDTVGSSSTESSTEYQNQEIQKPLQNEIKKKKDTNGKSNNIDISKKMAHSNKNSLNLQSISETSVKKYQTASNIYHKEKLPIKSDQEFNYSYKIPLNQLAQREKELEFRRKRLEELIKWKTKLDNEEKVIQEKEKEVSEFVLSTHTVKMFSESENLKSNSHDMNEQKKKKEIINNEYEDDIKTDSIYNQNDESYTQSLVSSSKRYKKSLTKEAEEQNKKLNSTILTASKYEDTTLKTEEDSISTASSKTEATDPIEIETKITYLKKELLNKKKDVDKLKKDLSDKKKKALKEKASRLERKIDNYDTIISDIRDKLLNDKDDDISTSNTNNSFITSSYINTDKKQSKNLKPDKNFQKIIDSDLNSETKDTTKYDEDFVSEENKSEDKIDLKNRENIYDSREFSDRDDMKSTISEISENIRNDEIENNSINKYDSDTNDSESSTDTQILLLGNRTSKPSTPLSSDNVIGNQSNEMKIPINEMGNQSNDHQILNINQNVELKKDEDKDNLVNENILNKIEILLVESSLNEMLLRRRCKAIKLTFSKNENLEVNLFKEEPLKAETPEIIELSTSRDPVIPYIDLDQKVTNCKLNSSNNFGTNLEMTEFRVADYTRDEILKRSQNLIDTFFGNLIQEKMPVTDYHVPIRNLKLCDAKINERKNFINEKLKNTTSEAQNFSELIFDLVGELIHELYKENYEKSSSVSIFLPGFRIPIKKQFYKNSLIVPYNQTERNKIILMQIENLLKLPNKRNENTEIKTPISVSQTERKSKWRLQKRLDLVDNLLDREMREEEHEWSVYELEEIEAKLMMADIIFETLLRDTVACFSSKKK